MREWSASSKNFSINVSFLGKLKTFIQLISISLLIYNGDIMHYNVFDIGIHGLYLAAIMSLNLRYVGELPPANSLSNKLSSVILKAPCASKS